MNFKIRRRKNSKTITTFITNIFIFSSLNLFVSFSLINFLTNLNQVAVIAGNLELAEMIQNYKPEDVGKYNAKIMQS